MSETKRFNVSTKAPMNEILAEHIKTASTTSGTSTGLDLLKLKNCKENYYAANTYLVALRHIQELEKLLAAHEQKKQVS